MRDSAEGGPGVLVDGGPHEGSVCLSLAGSRLHDHHDPFALRRRLHAHSLAVNEPVVAKRSCGPSGYWVRCCTSAVPLDQEAGAVPHDHPLQMRGHDGTFSRGSGRIRSFFLIKLDIHLP